jgi:hypothetical protein
MNNSLLPCDEDFVEYVAKAIAKDRLVNEASEDFSDTTGLSIDDFSGMDQLIENMFDLLWNTGTEEVDNRNREMFRASARAAIRAINLKLLTTP